MCSLLLHAGLLLGSLVLSSVDKEEELVKKKKARISHFHIIHPDQPLHWGQRCFVRGRVTSSTHGA